VKGTGKPLTVEKCVVGSCMVFAADWILRGNEREGRYCCVRRIGKQLTTV